MSWATGKTIRSSLIVNNGATQEKGKTKMPKETKIVKKCSCGLEYTESAFRALPPPASGRDLQEMPDDGDPIRYYLYRNCSCKSTIMLPLDKNKKYLED